MPRLWPWEAGGGSWQCCFRAADWPRGAPACHRLLPLPFHTASTWQHPAGKSQPQEAAPETCDIRVRGQFSVIRQLAATSAGAALVEERAPTSAKWIKKKRNKKKMVSRRDEGFLESVVCPHTVTPCYKDIRAKSWTSGLRTSWQLLVISRKFNLK